MMMMMMMMMTASFLYNLELSPNFWHLKHLSGFGMYRSTLTRRYPTLMWAGAVSVLNVRINVFVLRRSVLLSDFTVMWKQSVTPCERRPSTIPCFVRPFKSEHLMTPLQELRVRWGSAFTETPARSVRAKSFWLLRALFVSTSRWPARVFLTDVTVPMLAWRAFCIQNGKSSDIVFWPFGIMIMNLGKLWQSGAEQGPSDSESSAFDLLVLLRWLLWRSASMFLFIFVPPTPHPLRSP